MMFERLLAEATRLRRHRPVYPGENTRVEPIPYLRLPFTKEGLRHVQIRPSQLGIGTNAHYCISEGWYYSQKIRKVIPFGHGAVDFALPYGHPVVAPCDGYAMASYHSYPLLDRNGNVKIKNGIRLRFGIGYFVQIYNPERNRFVQFGHLSNIADVIPFSVPEQRGAFWVATGHTQTAHEIMNIGNSSAKFVRAEETIGFVGYSGLTDQEDYQAGYERPVIIDPSRNPSWSEPHIHMDEFQRNFGTGKKDWRRDPYDIYMQEHHYPTHSNSLSMGKEPLFLTDASDRPLFADS